MIIHMVLTSKRKSTPYKRLLMGMSICDVISSLSIPLWAFLLPKDSSSQSSRVWAVGNDTSCTAMGFFSQFSFSGILYNGMLSYYYLLTVRFAYQDRQMARCGEPFMHVLSIGFPTVTALIGAILGVYSDGEIGLQCWVDNYPKGCGDYVGVPCLSPLIGWIFGGWIMFFMIFSIVINNVTIYRFVRQTIYHGRRQSSFAAGQGLDSQTRRVQAVATQAFLYVGSFVLTYAWQMILRIIEGSFGDGSWESSLFPLLVLNAIFMPLQGVFNILVYARPNYLRARKDYPNESRVWCFRRALHGDAIQPTKRKKNNDRMASLSPPPSEPSHTSHSGFFIFRQSSLAALARQHSRSFLFAFQPRSTESKPQEEHEQQQQHVAGCSAGRGVSNDASCTSDIVQAPSHVCISKITSDEIEKEGADSIVDAVPESMDIQ
jgi:hypothetical protein